MKSKFLLAAACAAILSLTACGGGGGDDAPSAAPAPNPAQFSATDTALGTGAEATTGKRATVAYTGWLYSDTAADHKGTKFDSGTINITVGAPGVIQGFDRGVTGMKVGGKRTVLIPSSLGYGASGGGNGAIPPNAGLVFDVELKAVQ